MIFLVSDVVPLLLKAKQENWGHSNVSDFEKKFVPRSSTLILVYSELDESFDKTPFDFYFSIDDSSEKNIDSLFNFIKQYRNQKLEASKEKESNRSYLKLLKDASSFFTLASTDEKKQMLEMIESVYQRLLPLLGESDENLFESILKTALFRDLFKTMSFYKGDRLPLLKENDLLVPLDTKSEVFLYCELFKKDLSFRESALIILLFQFLKNFFTLNGDVLLAPNDEDRLPWEKILSLIDTPYVLLGGDGALLLHHQDFSRLSITPRECLQFKTGDKREYLGQVFSIFVHKINERFLVIFRTEKKKGANEIHSSNRELGVVSSSIAHELNNPLAGMLAAISLLFLEELSSEECKVLQDMKQSIERCKGLVEIFLGFSRMSPHLHKAGSLSQSFSQAVDLLRFRMVESNVRLFFETQNLENFKVKFNPSIMAMFFYIVLNELLTLKQKNTLLMEKNAQKALNISGVINANDSQIEILLEEKIDLESLKRSRLLSHLVDLLNVSIDVGTAAIKIRYLGDLGIKGIL